MRVKAMLVMCLLLSAFMSGTAAAKEQPVYKNEWVKDEETGRWSYYNSRGNKLKAPEDGHTLFQVVKGKKYAFDEEGNMLYGWVTTDSYMADEEGWMDSDTVYYLGDEDDGELKTGWQKIEVKDPDSENADMLEEYWFYFEPGGKKVFSGDGDNPIKEKSISGRRYGFDTSGRMVSGWVNVSDGSSSGVDNYKYFGKPDKGRKTASGWFKAVPDQEVSLADSEYGENKEHWYYTDKNGSIVTCALKTIGKNKYAFNEKGEMLTGLWKLTFFAPGILDMSGCYQVDTNELPDNDYSAMALGDLSGVYLFGDEEDGAMKTGKQKVSVTDTETEFFFKTAGTDKGKGANGEYKGSCYVNGRKVTASKDQKYRSFMVFSDGAGGSTLMEMDVSLSCMAKDMGVESFLSSMGAEKLILVDNKGKLVSSGKKTDADDLIYTVASGKVTGIAVKEQ